MRVFNVHEYGKNGKKHWHLVVFNHDFEDKELQSVSNGNRLYTSKDLTELWPYGFHTIGDITMASAMYSAQYMQKDIQYGHTQSEKKSHSKHSGIGRRYFEIHFQQILSLGYVPFDGKRLPIPRYFRKIAHKHWSYYNEPSNFRDTPQRKALYSPFSGKDYPNFELSRCFQRYLDSRVEHDMEREAAWWDSIEAYIFSKEKPEFTRSGDNFLYDLKNKPLNTL